MRLHNSQLGDAYQDEKKKKIRQNLGTEDWIALTEPGSYLNYVKSLSMRWPQLELLSDFMEVGTAPTRWCIFPGEEKDKNEQRRYTYPTSIPRKLNRFAEQQRWTLLCSSSDRQETQNLQVIVCKESIRPRMLGLPRVVYKMQPTPEAGYPLWRGYPNWDEMPEFGSNYTPQDPVRDLQIPPSLRSKDSGNPMSWFEEYIFWAQRTTNFGFFCCFIAIGC
ncbi:uncharacterized protein BKA55DRAFT_538606 [Fusarium redolens]|uniref:Uncharacterized protein n=1 Tax=Fusarium redolens TaxID=48865 RepID=A0A9P9H9Q2_FUSRE|nr:uncharacterized protein BKA55DRAFT_538606 [Fusarium redolens]KAH7253744.1 hypothetical protein BKA55DRAFT_538606 [Fusarium redolens]